MDFFITINKGQIKLNVAKVIKVDFHPIRNSGFPDDPYLLKKIENFYLYEKNYFIFFKGRVIWKNIALRKNEIFVTN